MLKLYDAAGAPSPRRARIFIAEKGIEVETILVNLADREQLGEASLKTLPRATVPALACADGTILSENLSIAAYLEEMYPEPPLMGTSAVEKALVLEWNWRAEQEGFAAVAEFFRNSHPKFENRAMTGPMDVAQIPALVDRGKARLAAHFEALNTRLDASPYLAGDNFTFADITAAVVVDFASRVSPEDAPAEGLAALHAWHAKVTARPSFGA